MTDLVFRGPMVPMSREMLDDAAPWKKLSDRMNVELRAAMTDRLLDYTVGPRYGPPAPYVAPPEPERCAHCGHVLDDEWDDE